MVREGSRGAGLPENRVTFDIRICATLVILPGVEIASSLHVRRHSTMITRAFRYELALLTILCVVVLLLFPAAVGSYASVHGPVTALLAFRWAMKIRWSMMLAGQGFSQLLRNNWLRIAPRRSGRESGFAFPPEYAMALRC